MSRTSRSTAILTLVAAAVAPLAMLTSTAVAATNPISLVSSSSYQDSAGYLHVVGEVRNQSTSSQEYVEVDLGLYDASGRLLDTDFTYTHLDVLAPGERGGFDGVIDTPVGYDHYRITSVGSSPASKPGNQQFAAVVSNVTSDEAGYQHLVGLVRNLNTTTATYVELDFIFRNASGGVVDTDFTFVNGSSPDLAAGARGTFELLRDGTRAWASYSVVAQATSDRTKARYLLPQTRVSGVDRYATAVAVSQKRFGQGAAQAVVLANGNNYPDALAGVPLASSKHAPLLLTAPTSLTPATQSEIQRVLPQGGTVYVLGGASAVGEDVAAQLESLGYMVHRLGGLTRYDTAVSIADAVGEPQAIFLTSGLNFPDALSAGAAAGKESGVVLLTSGSSPSTATTDYLSAHPDATVYAVGGPAAKAQPSAIALTGADRYYTSVAVARRFFPQPSVASFASGSTFPDALGGGAHAAAIGAPLVLVPPTGSLPSALSSWLATGRATIDREWLYGGTSAVNASVATAVR